jgi:hypothetical protein
VAVRQIEEGKVVAKTLEELEAMSMGQLTLAEKAWADYWRRQANAEELEKRVNLYRPDFRSYANR